MEALAEVKILKGWAVDRWLLGGSGQLRGARLRSTEGDTQSQDVRCEGAFMAIGRRPQTGFMPAEVQQDKHGMLLMEQYSMSHLPGLFLAGQAAAILTCTASVHACLPSFLLPTQPLNQLVPVFGQVADSRYQQAVTAAAAGTQAAMDADRWLDGEWDTASAALPLPAYTRPQAAPLDGRPPDARAAPTTSSTADMGGSGLLMGGALLAVVAALATAGRRLPSKYAPHGHAAL